MFLTPLGVTVPLKWSPLSNKPLPAKALLNSFLFVFQNWLYSFEYKNPIFGEGLFQGVMSDEAPEEAVIPMDGYNAVNYNMLDVEFKNM